jgi:hypothetical protein
LGDTVNYRLADSAEPGRAGRVELGESGGLFVKVKDWTIRKGVFGVSGKVGGYGKREC